MAGSQGFWRRGGGGDQARARLSTLGLFNNTKRGGVVFTGVKKIRGDGLVAWRGEVVVVWEGGYKPYPSPSAARAK